MKIKCIQCGVLFSASRKGVKICSDKCRLERKRAGENKFYSNNRDRRLLLVKKRQESPLYKIRKSIYDKVRNIIRNDFIKAYEFARRDRKYFGGNRKHILQRDGFCCTKCGSSKLIVVHHKDRDRKNNDMNNLVSLCRSCHMKEHLVEINLLHPNFSSL